MKKDYDSTRIYRNTHKKRVRHRLMTHPLNLFRYSSIFLPYIPHTVYSQLELVMDFPHSIYYFIVFMWTWIHVYMYRCVHEYTFKSRKMPKKRLFKAFFLEKSLKKQLFWNFFLATKKDFTLPLYLCIVKTRKYGWAA